MSLIAAQPSTTAFVDTLICYHYAIESNSLDTYLAPRHMVLCLKNALNEYEHIVEAHNQ